MIYTEWAIYICNTDYVCIYLDLCEIIYNMYTYICNTCIILTSLQNILII